MPEVAPAASEIPAASLDAPRAAAHGDDATPGGIAPAAPAIAAQALPDAPAGAAEAVVPTPPQTTPAPSAKPPRPGATPSFAHMPSAGSSASQRRDWRKPAAIAALSLLLALQLVLADRAQLAANARWRPLVATLCAALQCSVPPWREPAAFTLLHRDVRPHPTLPGVLHVSATFRNDARWPQPWPALLLTLSDVDGRSVGARAFVPREYLDGAPTHGGLASGQSATVAMDIIEPAPRIVAFTFDFH